MRFKVAGLLLFLFFSGIILGSESFAAPLAAPDVKIASAQVSGELSRASISGMISWIPPATPATNPIASYQVIFYQQVRGSATPVNGIQCLIDINNANCRISGNFDATQFTIQNCKNNSDSKPFTNLLVRVTAVTSTGEASSPAEVGVQLCLSDVKTSIQSPIISPQSGPDNKSENAPVLSLNAPSTDSSTVQKNETPIPTTKEIQKVGDGSSPKNGSVTTQIGGVAASQSDQGGFSSATEVESQPGGALFNSPDYAIPVTFQPFCPSTSPSFVTCRELPTFIKGVPGSSAAINLLGSWYVAASNLGSDMSPKTRRDAKKLIVATVIVGQLASARGRQD